ncbi:MAG: dienelactone hydrolase family protein [Planctomycetes bacterium]|nr:dienelactone hydrolase family protein [Planctomycetota bacterium]
MIALVILPGGSTASAEKAGRFVNRVYKDAAGAHKYVVFEPAGYATNKSKKTWPVILFLHGAGERGNDGVRQTTAGLGAVLKQREKPFPFVVVFPQCEDTKGRLLKGWSAESADGKRALRILADAEKNYRINPRRRILTGWSMGGYGTWSLAAQNPKQWAGVVPVAGGGDAADAVKLKDTPLWVFHGGRDRAVRSSESQKMIDAVRKAGGKARWTLNKTAGHNFWRSVYSNEKLIVWMANPVHDDATPSTLLAHPGHRPLRKPNESAPFIPAIEIPRAIYVRLGNDALKSMSYSVPSMVPRDMLTGRINDIFDSTVASGRTFNIQFSGITYSGSLSRAVIKAVGKDRLRVQLGLSNTTMSIARTDVTGRRRSAVAGLIQVVIGHRRPVWLTIDVTPYVKNRKLRLRLIGKSFSIPDDNWYVTAPAGVSTQGLGMTRSRVSSSLVSGLYGNKGRIEREVLAVVPRIVRALEDKLAFSEASKVVQGFWPLPVYHPRVRVWPEAISTDKDGVTVVLGLTAAAADPKNAPRTPRRVAPLGPPIDKLPRGTKLQAGVAPGILSHLTQLLIDADMARIHLLDIPGKKFAALADPKLLAEAIPDLKRFGPNVEIWPELILTRPLNLGGSDGDETATTTENSGAKQLEFAMPEVVVSIAVRNGATAKTWTPYVEFRFQILQKTAISVLKPDFSTRALKMEWIGDPGITVQARFAENVKPQNPKIDTKRIQQLFTDGWNAWTRSGPATENTIEDVDFGRSSLRLDGVGWSSPFLQLTFVNPGIKISNEFDKPLVYQTKGPYSKFSQPLTLKPGDSHTFYIAYPIVFRSNSGGSKMLFTLAAGSHSVFRAPKEGGPPQLFKARRKPAKKKKAVKEKAVKKKAMKDRTVKKKAVKKK